MKKAFETFIIKGLQSKVMAEAGKQLKQESNTKTTHCKIPVDGKLRDLRIFQPLSTMRNP